MVLFLFDNVNGMTPAFVRTTVYSPPHNLTKDLKIEETKIKKTPTRYRPGEEAVI